MEKMEKVDEVLLHAKFVELAEKCDTLEKMQKFCKSFMKKYPEEKKEETSFWFDVINQKLIPNNSSQYVCKASVSCPDYGYAGQMTQEHKIAATERLYKELMNQIITSKAVKIEEQKDFATMNTIITGSVVVVPRGEKK